MDIVAATRMLQSGQRESLKLTAPSVEGDYDYVCTYPAHYQVMWGRLVVTKDVEGYLRANPAAPIVAPGPAALSEDGSQQQPHGHVH